MNHLRLLSLCCALLSLPACELVASFDQSKLDQNRTLGPKPLPTLDGSVAAVVPDGSLRFDGALVRDDTGVPSAGDAASDAAQDAAANDASDGQLPDADLVDAGAADAGVGDGGDAGDASDFDASPADAGPLDAGLAPDLFADV